MLTLYSVSLQVSLLKQGKEMLQHDVEKRASDEVRNLSERVYGLQVGIIFAINWTVLLLF